MLEDSPLTTGDIMTRDVVTVFPDTSLRHVAKLLAERDISGVPVVDDGGHLVGMVTEGDLLRWHDDLPERQAWWLNMLAEGFEIAPDFLETIRSEREKVRNFMTETLVTAEESTPIRDAARRMTEGKVKRLPVLRDGKLVGIVSRGDLVRALARE